MRSVNRRGGVGGAGGVGGGGRQGRRYFHIINNDLEKRGKTNLDPSAVMCFLSRRRAGSPAGASGRRVTV